MKKLTIFLLSAFLLTTSTAFAREVSIRMGNFEPYYIENGNTGIFADLITAAFHHMPDHYPVFEYGFSNNALWSSFKASRADATTNVFDSVKLSGCRSDPVFRFHDVAVTRANANIKIDSIADLNGKSIVTFQGARKFFGKDFEMAINPNTYQEIGKPKLQARMLHGGRVDVSVGDLFIFLQSLKNMNKASGKSGDFVFHEIFPQISSRMGFHDNQLCAEFNAALKKIRQSGEYDKIYDSYLKKLGYK